MDNRVQIYNQQFVPEDLLPADCAWKKESKERGVKKRSNSLEYPPMAKNQHCIAHDHSKEQKFKANIEKKVTNDLSQKEKSPDKENNIQTEIEIVEKVLGVEEDEEKVLPAQILEVMRASNIKDIIRNMTVHEQLRMLRNIIDEEEFKRREKMRSDRSERQSREN